MSEIRDLIMASESIQPEGRRAAIAASFGQVDELRGTFPEVHLNNLAAALEALGNSKEGDTAPIKNRRLTCSQVAAVIRENGHVGGRVYDALHWFQILPMAFRGTTDPRQLAMIETANREHEELLAAHADGS